MSSSSDVFAATQPKARPQLRLINGAAFTLALVWVVLVALTLTREVDDFKQLRRGAVDLLEQGDPYATRKQFLAESPDERPIPGKPLENGFKYTPIFAYLFQPFGLLSHRAGQLAWFAINIAALVGLTLLCVRLSGAQLGRSYWGVLALGLVVAPPTRLSLQLGQISIVLALALVALYSLAQRRGWLASLVRGPRRIVTQTAASTLLMIGVFVPFYGIEHYRSFVDVVVLGSFHPYAADFNISLVAFWTRLLTQTPYAVPPLVAPTLARALIVASSLLVLACCYLAHRRGGGERSQLFAFNAWLCGMLLLSPINGVYNLVLLLLPLLTIARELEHAPSRRLRNWLLFATALVCVPPTWSRATPWLYNAAHTGWGVLVLTPAFYGLLIYFGLLVWLARQGPRATVSAAAPMETT
jgi:hypothetical protein